MSYWPCTHKADNDHGGLDGKGVRFWICSCCGLVAPWDEDWRYWGNIECRKCEAADMEYVACSGWCWDRLNKTTTLRNPGRKKGKP